MIDKTKLGLKAFDSLYGGVYRGRPTLCMGRHGAGKTQLALQCMAHSVSEGEHPLILTGWQASDLAIIAQRTTGFPLDEALERGDVVLMEYSGLETQQGETDITLPPASFHELLHIVESRGVSRVIFDTVLPWVAITQEDRLPRHVYSFIQALDRMGVTSLLTIPRPVSRLAAKLQELIKDNVPVAFTLEGKKEDPHCTLTINKYLGETQLPPPLELSLSDGQGLAGKTDAATAEPSAANNSDSGAIRFANAFNSPNQEQ